jgi:CDP-4-dehydro-6-deoxyglucose reductase, E3
MAELSCDGQRIALLPNENVLDALRRASIEVPSSCRAGACQSCLVQVTRGEVPERAQLGLKESLRAQGFVLACQAVPQGDLEVSVSGARALEISAEICAVDRLSQDVLRVRLLPASSLGYRPGQFLTLVRGDGLARAYSIASRPQEGDALELHVRVLPGGSMSRWLSEAGALGASVRLRGPSGECFYTAGNPEQPLVLAGVGSGLAPLWGIARDALAAGHAGPIELWHGARDASGLYLREELRELQAAHKNFTYHPCALEGETHDVRVGRLDELLLQTITAPPRARFFLCGDAPLVQGLRRALFLRGAPLREIFADAFLPSAA